MVETNIEEASWDRCQWLYTHAVEFRLDLKGIGKAIRGLDVEKSKNKIFLKDRFVRSHWQQHGSLFKKDKVKMTGTSFGVRLLW